MGGNVSGQDDQSANSSKKEIPITIVTDRPTQAVSPYIVPKGKLQIETGFGYERETNSTDDITRYSIANTLFRYSIFKNFEVRASTYYGIEEINPLQDVADSSINGFGPLTLGFKVHIIEEKGWRPEMAIVTNITLRHLGEESFAPTYSYPNASFLASYSLGKFAIVGNAGFSYNGENADGFFIYSVAFSYNILPKLAVFIEPYGNFDHGDLPNHKIDAGFAYVIRHNLLIDISGGIGLSKSNDKDFIALGLSWRIPK